jgi:hypothetical protein
MAKENTAPTVSETTQPHEADAPKTPETKAPAKMEAKSMSAESTPTSDQPGLDAMVDTGAVLFAIGKNVIKKADFNTVTLPSILQLLKVLPAIAESYADVGAEFKALSDPSKVSELLSYIVESAMVEVDDQPTKDLISACEVAVGHLISDAIAIIAAAKALKATPVSSAPSA